MNLASLWCSAASHAWASWMPFFAACSRFADHSYPLSASVHGGMFCFFAAVRQGGGVSLAEEETNFSPISVASGPPLFGGSAPHVSPDGGFRAKNDLGPPSFGSLEYRYLGRKCQRGASWFCYSRFAARNMNPNRVTTVQVCVRMYDRGWTL